MRKLREEFKSITWIDKATAIKMTVFTLAFSFAAGALIAVFNYGVSNIIGKFL